MRLAFVLLPRPAQPAPRAIAEAYARLAPNGPRMRIEENGAASAAEGALTLGLEGVGTVLVMPIPLGVPKGEAEACVEYSFFARGAGWSLPPHAAHLIVTMPADPADGGHALARLHDFTRVLAAVTQASGAVGIYWGNAHATHPPKEFIEAAASDAAHILLWNGISIAKDARGRLSMLSLGMGQLGLPDLLLTAPSDKGPAALETMADLLLYVAKRGKKIPEGETVGRTAEERIPVRYEPSPTESTERVWCVDLP